MDRAGESKEWMREGKEGRQRGFEERTFEQHRLHEEIPGEGRVEQSLCFPKGQIVKLEVRQVGERGAQSIDGCHLNMKHTRKHNKIRKTRKIKKQKTMRISRRYL